MARVTLAVLISVLILWGCSGTVDTYEMGPQELYNYAYGLYEEEDYREAILQFQAVLLQYPGSAVNDDAQYYLGLTYFKREQYILGAYEFSKLIRDIPASTFVPDCQFMLAESYYQLSPPYQLEQSYTEKAIEEFQAYIDFFPTGKRVEEAERKIKELNNKLAEKLYHNAIIYEKMEYFDAAIRYHGDVAALYHDTDFAPQSLYRKVKLLIDKERYTEASKDIDDFLRRYPDDNHASELQEIQVTEISNANGNN